jgi:predicted site-specific integrase-resolvase
MSRQNERLNDMNLQKKITTIPAIPKKISHIGVYCRVSIANESQQDSLENQISHYRSMIAQVATWELVDIYADKASGRSTNRPEFQ